MLYLVEGLNASGKTTYIKNKINEDQFARFFNSKWLNPLKWDHNKKLIVNELKLNDKNYWREYDPLLEKWSLSSYESILETFIQIGKFGLDYYWDRTWIGSFAYGNIGISSFLHLIHLYKKMNISLIFLNTPLNVCLDRFISRDEDRNYVKYFGDMVKMVEFWKDVLNKYKVSIDILKKEDYNVNIVEYCEP